MAANNLAFSLVRLNQFEEAKSLLLETTPMARHVLGESNETTLRMRWVYALALYKNADCTLDDLNEAVNTLGETARTARRVLGGAHPLTEDIEHGLRSLREALEWLRDAALGTS